MARRRKVILRRLWGREAQRAFDAYLKMGQRDFYRQPVVEGLQTFAVFCPKTPRRPSYRVGTSFIMPTDFDNPEGSAFTCFTPIYRRGRLIRVVDEESAPPGRDCKHFSTRAAALAWLTEQAEKLEC